MREQQWDCRGLGHLLYSLLFYSLCIITKYFFVIIVLHFLWSQVTAYVRLG